MIVLDTNVLSELMKPKPEPNVVNWVTQQSVSSLYTTYITQAEIFYGIALLPEGKRKKQLEQATNGLFQDDFAGRILPFDGTSVAMREKRRCMMSARLP